MTGDDGLAAAENMSGTRAEWSPGVGCGAWSSRFGTPAKTSDGSLDDIQIATVNNYISGVPLQY